MTYRFEQIVNRSDTNSTKWDKYAGRDILPFWVADMDFPAPDFILHAVRQRLDHPMLGYTERPQTLTEAFQGWLVYHYGWNVPEEWIVWLPGVVPGVNMAARTLAADAQLLIPTPIYYPFLKLEAHTGRQQVTVPLTLNHGRWEMDIEQMTDALTDRVRMVMIANPQTPTGRAYSLAELHALAEFLQRHDLLLVSDEIHCNILLDPDIAHLPIAHVVPDIAHRTVSLFAATKTYNVPGLSCAAAVIPDAALRKKFLATREGLITDPGPLSYVASEAAFNDRSDWLPLMLQQLRNNLAAVRNVVGERLTVHEATYLAWINVRDLQLNDADAYFEGHGLGLSTGGQFGDADFVRFNFACPSQLLDEGLARLERALKGYR